MAISDVEKAINSGVVSTISVPLLPRNVVTVESFTAMSIKNVKHENQTCEFPITISIQVNETCNCIVGEGHNKICA